MARLLGMLRPCGLRPSAGGAVLLLLWSVLAALSAEATAETADEVPPLAIQLVGQLVEGHGKPQVVVIAHVTARDVRLELTRSCAAGELRLGVARILAGHEARFDLDQPLGRCRYQGTLSARMGGERASMPLSFEAEIAAKPTVTAGSFDPAAATVTVTFNRPADRGVVEAFAGDGRSLGHHETPLGNAAPGEPLVLGCGPIAEAPLRLQVTIFDPAGLFGGVALYPWSLRIPHQEVEFPSGSAQLPRPEVPKLAESAARIAKALRQAGGQAPLRLYVVGYTDTVGDKAANRTLSLARAHSIASYFRAHGIAAPISIAGLGEEALAVATADETPEARNRRAEYILAVDPPAIAGAPQPLEWTLLR